MPTRNVVGLVSWICFTLTEFRSLHIRAFRSICSLSGLASLRPSANPLSLGEGSAKKRTAFTLAEVLITLGIIGVVAAMTMPTVIAKHQKQVTVNKLKKAYSVLSQMVIRTYADNGPVSNFLSSGESLSANQTEQFFKTYWLPYFNAPMVANPSFYPKPKAFTQLNGDEYDYGIYTRYGEGRILFSTQDGTIYYVNVLAWIFDEDGHNTGVATYNMLSHVLVDINGVKPPNTLGKDVFAFTIDFNNNVVKPYCIANTISNINANCQKSGNGVCCSAKIIKDDWQIASDYPW